MIGGAYATVAAVDADTRVFEPELIFGPICLKSERDRSTTQDRQSGPRVPFGVAHD